MTVLRKDINKIVCVFLDILCASPKILLYRVSQNFLTYCAEPDSTYKNKSKM
jgi:hypothetical protein